MNKEFDYIIVGGGTAGCIIAARLAQHGYRVALFEAGPSDEFDPRVLTLSNWLTLLGTDLDYDYPIEPQPRGNSHIRHARGKLLGGCSSHNSCIAFVAPDADMESWVNLGATGWQPSAVQPYYQRVLDTVTLEQAPPANACAAAFVEAAIEHGFPKRSFKPSSRSQTQFGNERTESAGACASVYNQEFQRGVGWFMLNKKGAVRQSSSVAYLHPLSQWDDKLTIFTQQTVQRILFDDGLRAIGVETADGPITCRGEVIVCGGAFDSPKLLMLSGIGPADHLQAVDVPVKLDLPGVGENLLDHPEGVVLYEAAQPVPDITTQFWEVGLFEATQPESNWPDLMFHFGTFVFDINTAAQGYPTTTNGFSIAPNVAQAKSQGQVRLRSNDPAAPPSLDFRYFTDPDGHDERVMLAGIKLARELAEQPAMKAWVKRELAPGPTVQSDAALSEYARRTANTVYHPAGTCKMGSPDERLTVVDPQLRVLGTQGLRVADASIFPNMISVNPAITCMMIGERCADFVMNEVRS